MKLKFKYLLTIVTAAILMTAVTACSGSDEPAPVPAPEPAGKNEPVDRAVLLYLLADNSLGRGGFDRQNLADMIQASATELSAATA